LDVPAATTALVSLLEDAGEAGLSTLSGGGVIEALEQTIAEWIDPCGTALPDPTTNGQFWVLAMVNGTCALHTALIAAGVGPGDEVALPVLAWGGAAAVILLQGATPVLVDTAPGTPWLDLADLARRITPRTRAVIVVHPAGYPAPIRALRSLTESAGIALVEDAAGALGACAAGQSVGTWGDFAAFSLGPTKPLSTGEGGLLVCRQPEGYARATSSTQHPLRALLRGGDADWSAWLGTASLNYRMHPLTAALALSQWPSFPGRMEARRKWANALSEALPSELPFRPLHLVEPASRPAGHRLMLRYEADETDPVPVEGIRQALAAEGVRVAVCPLYPPLDRLPLFRGEPAPSRALWSSANLQRSGGFPRAQTWCNREIVLTTGEATGAGWEREIEEVVAAFVKVWKQRGELAECPEGQSNHRAGQSGTQSPGPPPSNRSPGFRW